MKMIEVKMTEEMVNRLVDEWQDKSVKEFSQEFSVDEKTIYTWVKKIRMFDETLCPKKKRNGKSVLEDIVKNALSN